MDMKSGRIYTDEQSKLLEGAEKKLMEMSIPPTYEKMSRRPPKVGRNEPCPCGSGRKFKKCCLLS
jgi:uncharacterized protein YecA (UPF0149 family)